MPSYIRSDIKIISEKEPIMDNKSNFYYPNDVMDNSLKGCCCGASKKSCQTKLSEPVFKQMNIYPNNYIQQNNAWQNQAQNEQVRQYDPYQNNYADYNQSQPYSQSQQGYNQAQQGYNQSQPYNQSQQGYNQPQAYNQMYPNNQDNQKQKNLFGSLNPEQLMSLLSSKGSLGGILGNLGQSNPQLAMLASMMQNMPKAKKQEKKQEASEQPTETQKEKKFTKVKDYYKENPDDIL